jgi:hypothetical protein
MDQLFGLQHRGTVPVITEASFDLNGGKNSENSDKMLADSGNICNFAS